MTQAEGAAFDAAIRTLSAEEADRVAAKRVAAVGFETRMVADAEAAVATVEQKITRARYAVEDAEAARDAALVGLTAAAERLAAAQAVLAEED